MKQTRILSSMLLTVSLMAMGLGTYNLIEYVQEEAQATSTYEELTALHSAPSFTQDHYSVPATEVPTFIDEQTAATEAPAYRESDTVTDCNESLPLPAADNVNLPLPAAVSGNENMSGIASLNALNGDCVAWITIEGTPIDYPVMYRPIQTDYYLHRDFYGNYQSSGTLYIAEICNPVNSDNVIIYGHNMNSGRMFAALIKYKQRSFYEAHQCIRFETLDGVHNYSIICALSTQVSAGNDFAYYRFSDADSKDEFDAYVASCKARSFYDTGISAEYGDRLLTLSTCEYSQANGRMLVVAKQTD